MDRCMNAFSKDFLHNLEINDQPINAEILAELFFARAASASRRVGRFYRNAATYELFLLLAIADGSDAASIYNSVDAVESAALGHSALLKFIHEQVAAGNLHLETCGVKRSRRIIRLNPALAEELDQLLGRRSQLLAGMSGFQGGKLLAAE